jgi:hypothetical protein
MVASHEFNMLRQILLEHLAHVSPQHLPGVDGRTAAEVLRDYDRLAVRAIVPDRAELLRQHPQLAGEVESFFSEVSRPQKEGPPPSLN